MRTTLLLALTLCSLALPATAQSLPAPDPWDVRGYASYLGLGVNSDYFAVQVSLVRTYCRLYMRGKGDIVNRQLESNDEEFASRAREGIKVFCPQYYPVR